MNNNEEKANDLCYYVNTTKNKYFGIIKSQNETEVVMATPYIVNSQDKQKDISLRYIFEEYLNTNPEITLNKMSIESIIPATEETEFVRLYRSIVPMAQKRALSRLTIEELSSLVK
ncbi:MAG: hypothetical protein ACP5N1_04140 [Candidatus Woesearchaeota archaeon]